MTGINDFKDEINWDVYNKQNNIPVTSQNSLSSHNITIGKDAEPKTSLWDSIKSSLPMTPPGMNIATGMMSLAFPGQQGEMVKNLPQVLTGRQPGIPEKTEQFIGEMLPGLEGGGPETAKAGYTAAKKGFEYINPKNISESLRNNFGEGTVAENIEQFGNRLEFAKGSAKKEALIPKSEFMKEAQGKNITRLNPEKVDVNNVAKVFEQNPGEFTPERMKSIQKAINNYYKDGDIEKLAEKGAGIFGNPEISEKAMSKLESLLPIEELNKGSYLSNAEVSKFYSPRGDLSQAHNAYAKTKSVESADKLMSELKSEIRKLELMEKKGTIGDVASAKLESYRNNLADLKSDWGKFVETLPESARGKYADFTKKYAINVGPYEDASFIVRKLSTGDTKGILPESINRLFMNPNPSEKVLKIIQDVGPSGWNNLVYNMLSKYKPGDVKGMATAILEGKRAGSPIITDEMVALANNSLKRHTISGIAKSGTGAIAGALLGGPLGGAVGAVSPYLWANRDLLTKALMKIKK